MFAFAFEAMDSAKLMRSLFAPSQFSDSAFPSSVFVQVHGDIAVYNVIQKEDSLIVYHFQMQTALCIVHVQTPGSRRSFSTTLKR